MLAFGCQQQSQTSQAAAPADTRAADEAAVKSTEANWAKTGSNVDQFISFYSDDATVLPPNAPAMTGKETIKKAFTDMMGAPGFSLNFQGSKVEVAKSGDLAYTQGTYEMTMNDAKGKPMTEKGKYLTVWKKQGGDWKAVEDMFSSDLAAQPAGK
jgi:ketosteroid isomerase-like protein